MFISSSHRVLRTLALALAVAGVFALLAPTATAGKPTPGSGTGKYKNDPGCGGGSGTPPSPGNATGWLQDTTAAAGYYDLGGAGGATYTGRSTSCQTPVSGNTAASGRYNCFPADDLAFSTLQMSSMVFSKKYRNICTSFTEPGLRFPVSLLRFGWNDDCTDGSCSVEAAVNPDSAFVSLLTNGAADAVDLIFNGNLTGYASNETNPFRDGPVQFAVESIDLVFMDTGSGRVTGVCTAYPWPGITFFSTPN